jgi:nickel-dependent lactate racemase
MQTISLPYGSTGFALSFDPERFQVLAPADVSKTSEKQFLVDSPALPELSRNRRVLLIVSDLTRPTGSREFLPPLLRQLDGAREIAFLFATGLHRPLKDADKITIVGEDIFGRYPMLDHWPERDNVTIGTTSRGNQVEIDKKVFEYDLVVVTGAIGFHYFAGFSGGRKSLMPGVASKETITFNHLLVLNQNGPGRNPDVSVARLDGNPVHEDMVESVNLIGTPLFVFNTILSRQKRVESVYAGHWLNAHRMGCNAYLETHSARLKETRPFAIVSAGGFPRDINVIQAHKAYEFAQHAVTPGGTIILLAECREGMGHASFFPWFENEKLAEFEKRLRENYEVYGQTAYSLLTKAQRFNLILVSALEPAVVEKMGLTPAKSLEQAMSLAEKATEGGRGYIMPYGADVLPVAEARAAAAAV